MNDTEVFYYVTYQYETPTSLVLCAVTINAGRRIKTPADIDWLRTHIANLEAKDGNDIADTIHISNFIRLGA